MYTVELLKYWGEVFSCVLGCGVDYRRAEKFQNCNDRDKWISTKDP